MITGHEERDDGLVREHETHAVEVQPVDFTVDDYPAALVEAPDGKSYILVTEGVGWLIPETGFKVNDYDPACPAWTLDEIKAEHLKGKPVDLADWVRVFGSRLESNFYTWHRLLNA